MARSAHTNAQRNGCRARMDPITPWMVIARLLVKGWSGRAARRRHLNVLDPDGHRLTSQRCAQAVSRRLTSPKAGAVRRAESGVAVAVLGARRAGDAGTLVRRDGTPPIDGRRGRVADERLTRERLRSAGAHLLANLLEGTAGSARSRAVRRRWRAVAVLANGALAAAVAKRADTIFHEHSAAAENRRRRRHLNAQALITAALHRHVARMIGHVEPAAATATAAAAAAASNAREIVRAAIRREIRRRHVADEVRIARCAANRSRRRKKANPAPHARRIPERRAEKPGSLLPISPSVRPSRRIALLAMQDLSGVSDGVDIGLAGAPHGVERERRRRRLEVPRAVAG